MHLAIGRHLGSQAFFGDNAINGDRQPRCNSVIFVNHPIFDAGKLRVQILDHLAQGLALNDHLFPAIGQFTHQRWNPHFGHV